MGLVAGLDGLVVGLERLVADTPIPTKVESGQVIKVLNEMLLLVSDILQISPSATQNCAPTEVAP